MAKVNGVVAAFLIKTYDMVDDSSTNSVVSWSHNNNNSFVVWNVMEFATRILPNYFKHNNFSSFVRQLNTYLQVGLHLHLGIYARFYCIWVNLPLFSFVSGLGLHTEVLERLTQTAGNLQMKGL